MFTGKFNNYRIYAVITILVWATPYVLTKFTFSYFTASAISLLRLLFASLFLLIIAIIKRIGLPELRDIPKFLLSGFIGFSLYMTFFNQAMHMLSSATGSILIATTPVITAVLASFSLKEKLKTLCWFAIAIEFGGILILTLWNGVFSVNTGIFWMLGSALFLSIYNLFQRRFTKKYTAFQSMAYSIFTGTIYLLIYLPETIPQLTAAPPTQWLIVIFLGIFSNGIGYLTWSKALSIAKKTTDVTNFMFVTPLLATVMSYFAIAEVPTLGVFIGGGVIILGVVLFNKINGQKLHENENLEI